MNTAVNGQPTEHWDSPLPLKDKLLPVKPFELDLIPDSLRPWIADIAERMQCPPDFPAVGAMIAISSIVGRKAVIAPKVNDDWRVTPNLWGAIVGRPGVMKSPALSQVLAPLERLQTDAYLEHTECVKLFDIDARLSKMEIDSAVKQAAKAIESGDRNKAALLLQTATEVMQGKPPSLRRYIVNNSTVEALGEILIENPCGTLVYQDELYSLLKRLDKEGHEDARGLYLQGYDGNQSYTFDRILRGKNLRIEAVCISILGGIQPGRLQSYIGEALSGGSGDDGLIQRFGLLVWPDMCGKWENVDRWPDTLAKERALCLFNRLNELKQDRCGVTGELSPAVFRFSREAQIDFNSWRTSFESELRNGDIHPALESHYSKYRKLVPAMALLCALADGESDVSTKSLNRAFAWTTYLKSHAERVYHSGRSPSIEAATAFLDRIKKGDVQNFFSVRDIYRHEWSRLSSSKLVTEALTVLEDMNVVKEVLKDAGTQGGRPRIIYQINPEILAEVVCRE